MCGRGEFGLEYVSVVIILLVFSCVMGDGLQSRRRLTLVKSFLTSLWVCLACVMMSCDASCSAFVLSSIVVSILFMTLIGSLPGWGGFRSIFFNVA